MKDKANTKQVRFHNLLAYGSGDLFGGGSFLIIGMLYMYFLTETIGLLPIFASLVFAVGKIWDAISDPLMGYISDNVRAKVGRRRIFFLIGLIPIPISFLLLWTSFTFNSDILAFLYYSFAYIIFNTVFTMVMVPYSALNAEITTDYKIRTRLSGTRIIFSQFSALLAGTIPALIIAKFPNQPATGYFIMGVVFALLYTIPWIFVFFGTWELPYTKPVKEKGHPILNVFKNFKTIFINKSFRKHIIMYICSYSAMDILMAIFIYYLNYYLGRNELYPIAMGALLITQIAMLPVYVMISNKKGKAFAYIMGLSIWAVGMILSFTLSADIMRIDKSFEELSNKTDVESAKDFTLTNYNGNEIALSDFEGQFVHLNFPKWIHHQHDYFIKINKKAEKENIDIVNIVVLTPEMKYYKGWARDQKMLAYDFKKWKSKIKPEYGKPLNEESWKKWSEKRINLFEKYKEWEKWSVENKKDALDYDNWSKKFPELAQDYKAWTGELCEFWGKQYELEYVSVDLNNKIAGLYNVEKTPSNFIISPSFKVVYSESASFFPFIIIVCILIGGGLSAGVMIPWAILPSVTDVDELITTKKRAGTYSGAMTLIRKLVQGVIAIPVVGVVLGVIGYLANQPQTLDTLFKLKLFFMIGPITLIILGILAGITFKITPKTHEILRKEIERLKNGGDKANVDPEVKKVCEKLTGISYEKLYQ